MNDNDVKIKVSVDGADTAEQGLRGVGDGASDSDSKLQKLASGGLKGVAVAGAAMVAVLVAAGAGLWTIATGTAAAGDRIDEMSQKLGLSTQAYQEWDYILSQNGGSIDSLRGGLQRLNSAVDDARNGTGTAADNFGRLGISMDDLAGKSREQIFEMTIAGLQGVTDESERAAIATDLLGRGASELTPLLNQTAESTEELRARAQELGFIMSDEAVAAGDAFNDSLDTLRRTMGGVRNSIGAELLPGMTEVTSGLADLLAGTEGADARIKAGAETTVAALGTVLPRIVDVASTLVGTVASIAPQIIGSLITGISASLPSLVGTISTALVSLVTVLAAQAPALITAGAQAVVALVKGVASALPTLIPAVIQGILGMVQALIGAAPMLLAAGIELIMGLAEGILNSIPIIIAMLPQLIEGIVSFIQTGVPMLLAAGIELFMGIVEALPQIIDQLVAVLPTLITSVITTLLTAIPLIIQAGITLLTSLVTALPQIITSIVSALPLIITAILNAVLGSLPLLVQAGIDLFVALIGALPQIIVAIVQAIPQIITGVLNALINSIPAIIMAGVQLFTALITNLPLIISTIVNAMPQIVAGIVGALMNGMGQMAEVGMNLIRGLWNGISGSAGWLMGQISGFVNRVMSGIAGFFGIRSPSKRMEEEVGAWLPGGMGVGVKKHEQDAIRPIEDLNTKIMNEALKLNSSVAFTHDSPITAVPLTGATPQQSGPSVVQATLDAGILSEAIADALASIPSDDRAPVALDTDTIRQLGDAIVEGVTLNTRQGSSPLG